MSITTPQNDAVVEALKEASDGREDRARAGRRRREDRPRKVKVHYDKREALAGYMFILPWIAGFLVFTAGAMVYSLYISFSNYNLATNTASPVGIDNYARLFEDPRVGVSLANTLFYVVMAVPLEIIFALVLAMLLDRAARATAGFWRTLYYLSLIHI